MKLLVIFSLAICAYAESPAISSTYGAPEIVSHGGGGFGGGGFSSGAIGGGGIDEGFIGGGHSVGGGIGGGGFGGGGFGGGGFGGGGFGGGGYSGGGFGGACGGGLVRHVDGSCVEPIVKRNVFLYAAPHVAYPVQPAPYIPKPRLDYNIVLVRTPEVPLVPPPVVVPPPHQKTLVYVLNKNLHLAGQQVIEVPHALSEPEVYYVNYDEGDNPVLPGGIDLQSALSSAAASQGKVIGGGGGFGGGGFGGGLGGGFEGGHIGGGGLGGGFEGGHIGGGEFGGGLGGGHIGGASLGPVISAPASKYGVP